MVIELLLAMQPDPAALIPIYKQAVEQAETRKGSKDPEVARRLSDLGLFLHSLGLESEAAEALQRALDIDSESSDGKSELVAEDYEHLAEVRPPPQAAELLLRAGESIDAKVAARALFHASSIYSSLGANAQAVAAGRRAVERDAQPTYLNNLALLLTPAGAEPLLRRALAMQLRTVGEKNVETATTKNNLANMLLAQGKVTAAEPLLRQAIAVFEATIGPFHPRLAAALSNLADVQQAKGDLAAAEKLYLRALKIDEAAYGAGHPEVQADRNNLEELRALRKRVHR